MRLPVFVKPMNPLYQVSHEWERLARLVVEPQQIALVIGATDVGKSTFCRFLVERGVERRLKVGFVDADVGQSQIGPPTTIGLKILTPESEKGVEGDPLRFDGKLDALYFVGWTSPEHHLLQCVTGTRLMVDAAHEAGADFIVVDTTGYVEGPPAVILKQHKIELVKPDHLIGIHRSRELDAIIAGVEGFDALQVHRLLPHQRVVAKSSEFRRRHRESCFERYFSDSVVEGLSFDQIHGQRTPFFIGRQANAKELEILSNFVDEKILYAEWGHRSLTLVTLEPLPTLIRARLKDHFRLKDLVAETSAYFERRLVGLLDAAGKTLSIGVIEVVDFSAGQLKVRCKAGAASETKAVQFGRCKEDQRVEKSESL